MDVARPIYEDPLFSWKPQPSGTASAEPLHPVCNTQAEPPPADEAPSSEFMAIIAVLENRLGKESAITAAAIAAAAGLWPNLAPNNAGTKVRGVLEMFQDRWPFPICGDSDGYYRAAKAEELTHYCANLRSRALCNFRRFATVRRTGRQNGFVYLGHGRWSDQQPKGGPSIAPLIK